MEPAAALKLQAGNGLGQEDSQMIIEGMAQQGTCAAQPAEVTTMPFLPLKVYPAMYPA